MAISKEEVKVKRKVRTAEEEDNNTVVTAPAGKNTDFAETLVNVRRVTKVISGGRRMAFSALVVVGDRQGKVGVALGKGREVASAVSKAFKRARKSLVAVSLYADTIPYPVVGSYGASTVMLRPASKGTGIIAGGAVRIMMEALGVKDVLAKSLGAANSQNVVKATLNAFSKLRSAQHLAHLRGKSVKELIEGSNVTA